MTEQTAVAIRDEIAQEKGELTGAIIKNVNNLLDQSSRVKVDSQETLEAATDLVKLINTNKKKADAVRLEIVKPLKAITASWDAKFREGIAKPLDAEANRIKGMMGAYIRKQEEIARKAAEEEALKQAEEAAKRQQEAEEAGDIEAAIEAEQETEQALATPVEVEKKVTRGNFGGSAHTRKVWKGEVEDLMKLVMAVSAGAAPIELLQVNQVVLNQQVKDGVRAIPGVKIWEDSQVVVR